MSLTTKNARQGFRWLNHFVLLLWRLGLGGWVNIWPRVGGRIMVLTHIGRKSGQKRRTPVNYTLLDGDVYCVAGFGEASDWYRNVKANPAVEVWLPQGWWAGHAEEVTDNEARAALLRQVLIASGVAAYAAGLDPVQMSDAELLAAAANYRLIRIRRTEACTGAGGPGDLAWLWPAVTLGLLALLVFRRR
jgi:deazaflavin-dependent oxidoreductase (nitroreductase family)